MPSSATDELRLQQSEADALNCVPEVPELVNAPYADALCSRPYIQPRIPLHSAAARSAEQSPATEVRRLMATDEGYDAHTFGGGSARTSHSAASTSRNSTVARASRSPNSPSSSQKIGRVLLLARYFSSTVLAAAAILNAGGEAESLPALASERRAALAVTEPNGAMKGGAVRRKRG